MVESMCSDVSKSIQGTEWWPQGFTGRSSLMWWLLLPSSSQGIADGISLLTDQNVSFVENKSMEREMWAVDQFQI